jgi:hypothetical protein
MGKSRTRNHLRRKSGIRGRIKKIRQRSIKTGIGRETRRNKRNYWPRNRRQIRRPEKRWCHQV